jgi:hypothetical protein
MTRKSEVFEYIRRFVLRYTKGNTRIGGVQWGCDLKELRSDNGGEYKSHQFSDFCKDMGIHQQFSEKYTPEQNGAAERINRTLLEMANSMMKHALPAEADLWALACETAAYVRVRCLSSSGHPTKSPHELLTGQKPDLSHMRVWGCLCYVYIHSEKRKKLMDTAKACRFVGYDANGYKVVVCATGKVEVTREIVRFDESVFDMKTVGSVAGVSGNIESILESPRQAVTDGSGADSGADSSTSDSIISDSSISDRDSSSLDMDSSRSESNSNCNSSSDGWSTGDSDVDTVAEVPYESDSEVLPSTAAVVEFPYESDSDGDDEDVPDGLYDSDSDDDEGVESSAACSLGTLPSPHTALSAEFTAGFFAPTSSYSKPLYVEDDHCPYRLHANSNCDMWAFVATSLNDDSRIPKSFAEAQSSEHWLEWKAAIDSELKSLLRHETWDEIDESVQPGDYDNVVGSKWVFDIKTDKDGNIIRYKARLVAQGFTQVEGVDYKETYAPVANRTTLRLVMSLAAQMDLELEHMDVCTAFLNAHLPEGERMHMRLPPGVKLEGKSSIVQLLRCLYGLKQSPREWNKVINAFLIKLGYTRCKMDPCLYTLKDSVTETFSFILLYVDDLIMASSSVAHMEQLKGKLHAEYDMKDLGALSYCLGLAFTRDRKARTLEIDQEKYIRETLNLFDMSECFEASTPADPNIKLSPAHCPKSKKDVDFMSKIPYREAVGRVLYIMCCTRPDIAFAVNQCARFMDNPGIEHWNGILRILRYLKRTMKTHLTFGRMIGDSALLGSSAYSFLNDSNCKVAKNKVLLGFSDADHAGCPTTRRSTTGYIFFFNGPISWSSKLQQTAAQSPCESEYMAVGAAANESRWLSQLMNEISPSMCEDVIIFEDNTSTIGLANNGKISTRSKHIDVKYHAIQEFIEAHYLRLLYCDTKRMCADALTKNLGPNLSWGECRNVESQMKIDEDKTSVEKGK